ncbi:MAG: GldG family protein [SAR324 cluster bacterium]|nr:GldG family protein [SAR324 cluster bacterium]
MKKSQPILIQRLQSIGAFAMLAVALIAVNVIASLIPLRIDITEEGLYTLSQGTNKILAKLEHPVKVKYFFNAGYENLPVSVKTYARKVRELLREYESRSGGKLTLEVLDPQPDTDEEQWARRYGLQGPQLPTGDRLFHGMVVLSGEQEAPVPYFDSRREKFLEYDISEAISRAVRETQEKVGIMSFLPMIGQFNPRTGKQEGEWAVISELRKIFELVDLILADVVEIPEDIDLVMLIHPKLVTATTAYALDQFLVRGGRLMVFTDPFSRHDTRDPNVMDSKFSSNLKILFDSWKIKFSDEEVVADLKLATRVNTQAQGVVEFPVWVTLRGDHFNRDSVITSQLETMILPDAGAFETAEGFQHKLTPLLTSSDSSGMVDRITVRMAQGPLDLAKSIKVDGKSRVLSALVTGMFDSAYPDGPPPLPEREADARGKKPAKRERTMPHVAKAKVETSILLVGDADFLADRFSVRSMNFFGQPVLSPLNDNLNFVLNATEFMVGNQELIHIRSRGQISRPFTKVAELQVSAQMKYQEREKKLSETLREVQERLAELQNEKTGAQKVLLNPAQFAEVKKFRMEEVRTRKALREVRKVLRQDIESLGNRLLLINLLAVPLLVALFGFITIIRRTIRSGGKP